MPIRCRSFSALLIEMILSVVSLGSRHSVRLDRMWPVNRLPCDRIEIRFSTVCGRYHCANATVFLMGSGVGLAGG